jgi:CheY-like chemotaxis protein
MAKILIVEDECTALNSLATLLQDEGYETLKAEDGERALTRALSAEPDLILLDIRKRLVNHRGRRLASPMRAV